VRFMQCNDVGRRRRCGRYSVSARHNLPTDGDFGGKTNNGHTDPVIDERAQGRMNVTRIRRKECTKHYENLTRAVRRSMTGRGRGEVLLGREPRKWS
jgi:hypothetical protein